MSEYTILYVAFGSMIGLSLACLLYALGGRSGKWKRRFMASFILATTVNIASLIMQRWSFWLLGIYPLLIAGFSLGYGANSMIGKVIRRSIYALGVCACGGLFWSIFGYKMLWVAIPHIGVGLFSIYLGVRNPIYAAAEEVFVCALLNIGLCMYPFINLPI
jgi:hypothetical protein